MINLKDELQKYKPIADAESGQAAAKAEELTDLIDILTQMQKKLAQSK
ncbi:MAG: hypothetical protein LBK41_05660 [Clostridiales bacterium]|jgi:hypothetical protein|nr:hypothetical protein [Clostridiales bacterium]